MEVSEQETREKWCPMVRIIVDPHNRLTTNRELGKKAGGFNCIASDCMMWRIDRPNVGYCGLGGKPYQGWRYASPFKLFFKHPSALKIMGFYMAQTFRNDSERSEEVFVNDYLTLMLIFGNFKPMGILFKKLRWLRNVTGVFVF